MAIGFLKRTSAACAPAWARPVGLLCIATGTAMALFDHAARPAGQVDGLHFVRGLLMGIGMGLLVGALMRDRRARR